MQDNYNIINVREGESLYQISRKLRKRLSGVPGFQPYLDDMEQREEDGSDPVSSLWQCFRTGLPLLTIYNASQPEEGELKVKKSQVPDKIGKEAAYLFTKACKQQMNIPDTEIFTLTDLFSDNTTGFVKVTKVVNRVLDLLSMSGKLQASTDSDTSEGTDASGRIVKRAPKQMTRRDHILKELVDSERHYVHHLQNLQAMKKELEEAGGRVAGDSIHNIFLNLNNLLDFAQRFLIRIEQQHELPEEEQNWGQLFVRYKEPFRQYEPFIANQKRCELTCAKEWTNMKESARSPLMHQMLENPTVMNGFLIKPFQRLTKYPLLLKDLEKQTEDPDLKEDINKAVKIIQEVLNQADASIDKESREDALVDFQDRVANWKNLNIGTIGELLMVGIFPVIKEGPSIGSKDRDYSLYLFSRILVLCKEVNVKKEGKDAISSNGKIKFNIKGRIYFANVHSCVMTTRDGMYVLSITWKGDTSEMEHFTVKFRNEETMRKWHDMIMRQRSACLLERGGGNTSSTQLTSLIGANLVNPYAEQDDDEDYNRMSSTTYGGSEYAMSRNTSSTSLRQRSATGSSAASSAPFVSQGRMRGPTNEMNRLPRLNTAQSPAHHPSDSYFSPVDSTPPQSASTRSSAQSAYAATQRNAGPESHYRNTAPAMGRNDPRTNPYGMPNGRHPQRPSLPPGSVHSANNLAMNRMRAASSPDIHPQIQQNRKYAENIPAVPSIPSHMSKQMQPPSRSQSSSPNNLPLRGPPGQRPQMGGHGYTYDPSYSTAKSGHAPQMSQDRTTSPPDSNDDDDDPMPSQLKAKVRFDDNYVSMIIPTNITFRTLTDRIDAKLARFTHHAIATGTVKLRYQDQDGDYVLIDSDEAVSEALLDWKETHADRNGASLNAEISLFAHVVGDHGG
ncbi:Guanine nucleotide exchange factor for Cdc42p [Knufia fluminis]|uniref:Guanine nucleotide exchange factor for Cdc42p n=1 Tax=Knufia fluminis TaxID=191047 RepID=A0AAN8EK51_9EURO|nr:Guanine nucleotide exchange factor for Cdc42p [Knufia fluminis]